MSGSEQHPTVDGGRTRGDPPSADLPPGASVGEYRVERLLGRGGMGAVYLAQQPEIGAHVAIKVLDAGLSRDPRLVRRFVDEARAVNKIRHPGIIDIFAFGRLADGREYFVMEYLEGETLAARLERGPLPPSDARRLLTQICEALEAAHAEKIVHRDLKPENLFIATPKHGQPYAKVLDFGIAKLMESGDPPAATEAGVAMGTAHYMSPEQCRGEGVDHRTDIYAMGVLLYLIVCGRLPFEAPSFLGVVTQQITALPAPPSAHRPIAPRLERLIMSCLEKDPAARPPSARALGEELGEALGEVLPGETLPPGGGIALPVSPTFQTVPPVVRDPADATEAVRPRGRGRGKIVVAAAFMIAVAIAGGTMLVMRGRAIAPEPARAPAAPAAVATPSAPAAEPPPAATVPAPTTPPAPVPAAAAAGAPAPPPRSKAPSRERARPVAPAPPAPRPASRLDERGFLKENPFR